MASYKDMAELAGYTSRVYSLLSTMHELDAGRYQSVPRPAELPTNKPFYDLGHINGVVVRSSETVEFENTPIVAPAPGLARGGEELVKRLNVTIRDGEHLLITGPNVSSDVALGYTQLTISQGVGKTGFARVLAKLWPCFEGIVRRPDQEDMMFMPQRPYLSLGSLRDQIIYPDSWPDMQRRGRTDEELIDILKHVHLSYLPGREGGLDTRKEWKDGALPCIRYTASRSDVVPQFCRVVRSNVSTSLGCSTTFLVSPCSMNARLRCPLTLKAQ